MPAAPLRCRSRRRSRNTRRTRRHRQRRRRPISPTGRRSTATSRPCRSCRRIGRGRSSGPMPARPTPRVRCDASRRPAQDRGGQRRNALFDAVHGAAGRDRPADGHERCRDRRSGRRHRPSDGRPDLVGHCVHMLPFRSPLDWDSAVRIGRADGGRPPGRRLRPSPGAPTARWCAPCRCSASPIACRSPRSSSTSSACRRRSTSAISRSTVTPNAKAAVTFDLFVNVIESAAGLRIDCDYSTALFDEATIARWMEHYRLALESIVAAPGDAARGAGTPVDRADAFRARRRQRHRRGLSRRKLRPRPVRRPGRPDTPDAWPASTARDR